MQSNPTFAQILLLNLINDDYLLNYFFGRTTYLHYKWLAYRWLRTTVLLSLSYFSRTYKDLFFLFLRIVFSLTTNTKNMGIYRILYSWFFGQFFDWVGREIMFEKYHYQTSCIIEIVYSL